MRILFILKRQHLTSGGTGGGFCANGKVSSGLYNSALFVSDMLAEKLRHTTKLVIVHDNSDIDREVTLFKADAVVIEALWVVPEKFRELHKHHPHVKWVIRNHSAMPFLAQEGIAMQWLLEYPKIPNVFVSSNDLRTHEEIRDMLIASSGSYSLVPREIYLPNFYPTELHLRGGRTHKGWNVGCFGALRPLKNQLIQAVAAIRFGEATQKKVFFHMNTGRVEGGENIVKNIRQLFQRTNHELVEHGWLERDVFIDLLRKMDINLQCSFSETFNIVTADAVMNDVPVVTSLDIEWAAPEFAASPNSSHDIERVMHLALKPRRRKENVERLRGYSFISVLAWAACFPATLPPKCTEDKDVKDKCPEDKDVKPPLLPTPTPPSKLKRLFSRLGRGKQ